MTAEHEDLLSEAWALFERRIPMPKESPFQRDLEVATEVTQAKMQEFITSLGQVQLNADVLSKITADAVRIFLATLQTQLKGHDLTGLIAIILEGQDLEPEELKGFVRALPEKLLNRAVDSALGKASGTQALMAIEWHYRHRNLHDDYSLRINSQGRFYAKIPQPGDQEIVLFLDDEFDGLQTPETNDNEHDTPTEV